MAIENKHDLDDLKQQYKKLLEDPDFEKLEIELRKPNIFSILGIGRMEIRHSNFLAWLLDPNGSHGLGYQFLIRVLRDLSTKDNELDILDISNLNFSDVEVNREVPISLKDKNKDGSIDILIIFRDDKLVLCIENKIDTTDTDGQLTKYGKYVKETFEKYKNILVYLTPNGANPNDTGETKWNNYSYKDGIIKHLGSIQNSITDSTIKTYISDYLTTLKSEIMSTNDSATDLADKIFKANPEIFKFVFENKSNELYKLDWEKYHWVIKYAEKLVELLQKDDNNIESDLEFTKAYISIRRNNQICYTFSSREREPNCSMDFNFDPTKENEGENNRISIDKLLSSINKDKCYKPKNKLFSINEINHLIEKHSEILQAIHKIRFGID